MDCLYSRSQAEVDDTLKRIQEHKGVQGYIIINNDGEVPIHYVDRPLVPSHATENAPLFFSSTRIIVIDAKQTPLHFACAHIRCKHLPVEYVVIRNAQLLNASGANFIAYSSDDNTCALFL